MKNLITVLIFAVVLFITGCSADNKPVDAEIYDNDNNTNDLINPPVFESEPETEPDSAELETIAETSAAIIIDNVYPEIGIPGNDTKLIEPIPAEKSPDPEKLPHPDGSAKVIKIIPEVNTGDFSE